MPKFYEGRRKPGGEAYVLVKKDLRSHGLPLNPQLDIVNHSPSGLEWGYGGSGPSQLAIAIVADCSPELVGNWNLSGNFKWDIIAWLPQKHDWQMNADDVVDYLNGRIGKEEMKKRVVRIG